MPAASWLIALSGRGTLECPPEFSVVSVKFTGTFSAACTEWNTGDSPRSVPPPPSLIAYAASIS